MKRQVVAGGRRQAADKGLDRYATAVPFDQLSIPGEQATGADGFAELSFRALAGFPASSYTRCSSGRASQEKTCSAASPHAACSPVPVSLSG